MLYVIGGGLIGWLLSVVAKAKARHQAVVTGAFGHPYPTPVNHGVPFAQGPAAPTWPIHKSSKNKRKYDVSYKDVNGETHNRGSRRFKASRGDGARYHAGIDIFADDGDVVLSPESGVIVADQNFLGSIPGEDAMLIQGDSGTTILLGEIVAESMTTQFGLKEGSRVKKGQPVAIVALTANGSHMLHFETYTQGADRNRSWKQGQKPHPTLRDPTAYLLRARATTGAPFP
jgi:murein DD-endopeptidase MepM/ murein hydrolase activator NlpD